MLQLTPDEVRELVRQHDGLEALVVDPDEDGIISIAELSTHIVPILFGVATRASSYRQHLTRVLNAEGYSVSMVGHSCHACVSAEGGAEEPSSDDRAGWCQDEWLRWHGCDDEESNFLGFWGWSAQHILQGHPNQPHRGSLAQWLGARAVKGKPAASESGHRQAQAATDAPQGEVGGGQGRGVVREAEGEPSVVGGGVLYYDVVLVHLGTNDLAASTDVAGTLCGTFRACTSSFERVAGRREGWRGLKAHCTGVGGGRNGLWMTTVRCDYGGLYASASRRGGRQSHHAALSPDCPH